MRSFHEKEMTEQQIYENIISRKTGMDYSTGIRFEKSLIDMDKTKSPTNSNHLENPNPKQKYIFWCTSRVGNSLRYRKYKILWFYF